MSTVSRRTMIAVFALLCGSPALAGVAASAARAAAARRTAQSSAAGSAASGAVHAAVKPHDVYISRSRHPQAAAHIEYAQRQGQPTVLHIDRSGAAQRRAASTGSVDPHRKPGPLHERDEYPPAFVREGGVNANVRYIHRFDNRGAGATLRAQTQHLPDGARIRIVLVD
jgi:hypothetical protein